MPQQRSNPIDKATVQQSISTCQRCRRLRRKCDTQLPACRLCEKAKAECMQVDHALQQTIPRSYVHSLLTRFERLQVMKTAISTSPIQCAPIHNSPPIEDLFNSFSSPANPAFSCGPSFDTHFILPSKTGDTSRFFGSSSVFALTVEILNHAYAKGIVSNSGPTPATLDVQYPELDKDYVPGRSRTTVNELRALITLYLESMNTLYGFLDASAAEADLSAYLELRSRDAFQSPPHGHHAHQYFRISMICAIACANQARYQPSRAAESMAYYSDALTCVEEVTSEVSPASLQALLLLTLFCLFYPRKGDIWKLLDYACRLSIELGYHTEQTTEREDENQRKIRQSTFWGLYAIERIVGQLFGRGSDLPEAIITTEYPSFTEPILFTDQTSFQPVSIAHHYRLVYLRSEIYRDLYLPIALPDFGLSWYKERHATLVGWRQELEVTDDLAGIATVTCDVGYYSTMCFLFQPLMLCALSKTTEPATDVADTEKLAIVPQDNYWAACELVKAYERVIRAPQNSVLGAYPMTFMSAHYIYLAGLTLMAHALLALDGRITTLGPLEESGADSGHHPIHFSNIPEVTGSCLILLGWCAEKFPAMMSMLAVFKKLSDKLVPALIRRGLA